MNQVTTKRDLVEQGLGALDPSKSAGIAISREAGGVSFASALEVMEFAKLMAVSQTAVPSFLRNNPGMCLAVTFQAIEWRMSPFAVANKAYSVNDRIAYESQLIHGVIEARAPLRERLIAEYIGEAIERQCRIVGKFSDGTERDYVSPKIKDIKVKNSPLWTSDPDQQLFYYATRAWCRRWAPDVIMGLYTPAELRESPALGSRVEDEPEANGGLHARLVGTNVDRKEGLGAVDHSKELDEANGNGKGSPSDPKPAAAAKEPAKKEPKVAKAKVAAKPDPKPEEPANGEERVEHALPKDAPGYVAHAEKKIAEAADPDALEAWWRGESKLRNACGVVSEQRDPLMDKKNKKIAELEEAKGG